MEQRIVQIRVGRPSQGFPLMKEYSRNRAGRRFTGSKLYLVVDDETFDLISEIEDPGDAITEAQLEAVKRDAVFRVMDPYEEPTPEEQSAHLRPYREMAARIAKRNREGKLEPIEQPEWTKPKGPVLKRVSKPKYELPEPPTREEIVKVKAESETLARQIQRKQRKAAAGK